MDQVADLEELISDLGQAPNKPIAIDTETNITDSYEARYCMGISIAQEDNHWYIPVGHLPIAGVPQNNISYVPIELFEKLQDHTVIMHNAKFDLHVMKSLGFQGRFNNLQDTMLMSHYIDENESHKLEDLAAKYSPVKKNVALAKAIKTDWDHAFIFGMDQYAKEDALATLHVYNALVGRFEPYREAWESYDRDFLHMLLEIEAKGLILDKEACGKFEIQCRQRMKEIEQELGFDPAKPSILRSKLFDPPPVGLGLKPLSYTPKKKEPQVDKAFLEFHTHPVCALVWEYRQMAKMASSYFRNYLTIVGEGSRLHPTFKMHGTVTGRLSCENPNLQQIPRESDVKKMFLPDEGKQLWEIDFKNIEMRMAAVYANQPRLLDAFSNERDVHQEVADMLGITRQVSKIVSFLIIYGGGAETLAAKANIPFRQARQTLDRYRKQYPEIFSTMKAAEEASKQTGSIRMFSGRVRHFKYPSEYRKAFNAVIQGGSFEIVKRAMLRLQEAGYDVRNQVHDSVWLNVNSEDEVKAAEEVMQGWTKEDFGLQFTVESKRLR